VIAAHGNSLRALVKYLDNISDADIVELNIPTGQPLVYDRRQGAFVGGLGADIDPALFGEFDAPGGIKVRGVDNGQMTTSWWGVNGTEDLGGGLSAVFTVQGFMRDMARIGRADDVVLMAFSEFGRRVPENTSLGTDHGTAGPMFIVGRPVKGGHYSTPVSLTQLSADDNLVHTADFRRTYATLIEGWLGVPETTALLGWKFEPFPVFG